jgi:hypothetical protein
MPQKFICQISRVSECRLAIFEIKVANNHVGNPKLIQLSAGHNGQHQLWRFALTYPNYERPITCSSRSSNSVMYLTARYKCFYFRLLCCVCRCLVGFNSINQVVLTSVLTPAVWILHPGESDRVQRAPGLFHARPTLKYNWRLRYKCLHYHCLYCVVCTSFGLMRPIKSF